MKSFLSLVLALLLAVTVTGFADSNVDAKKYDTSNPLPLLRGDEEVNVPVDMPGFTPRVGELDELIGDTLIVGFSAWDAQHNGSSGRMIGFYPGSGDDWEAYVVYSKLDGISTANPRHVHYTRVMDDGQGGLMMAPNPSQVCETDYRSGYTTLVFDYENNVGYPTFHVAENNGDDFVAAAVVQNPFVPTIFNSFDVPPYGDVERIWPHSVFGTTNHVHMIMHESRQDDATAVTAASYFRFIPDPVTGTMTPDMSDGEQFIFPEIMMNISTDLTVDMTGDNLALGMAVSRFATIGEDFREPGADDQVNNDLYIYLSDDAGETWDTDNPIDVTQFIPIQPAALPDTVTANQDTFRAYTDCSVIFDAENNLHAAFTVGEFYFYGYPGIPDLDATVTGRIFHHMERGDSSVWTQINNQPFVVRPEGWARTTDRPNLFYDMDTDILWCTFRAMDGGPDTTDFKTQADDLPYGNADIYVTASPPGQYNGLLWTKPINITNTIWTDPNVEPVPGQSQSESDPTIPLRCEGEYLMISYLKDLDPGTAIAGNDQAVGEMTQNPMVVQRVSKQMLLDMFDDNAEWQHNYPMHIDSTGFWQDPYDYEWEGQGGFYRPGSVGDASSSLQPHEIDLKQNYPNPFNPSTKIAFSLDRPANVKLAVYDVLGREVVTLLNRGMSAGSHNVLFLAEDLPSGVYFYKLNANGTEKTRKMVLLK